MFDNCNIKPITIKLYTIKDLLEIICYTVTCFITYFHKNLQTPIIAYLFCAWNTSHQSDTVLTFSLHLWIPNTQFHHVWDVLKCLNLFTFLFIYQKGLKECVLKENVSCNQAWLCCCVAVLKVQWCCTSLWCSQPVLAWPSSLIIILICKSEVLGWFIYM